MSCRGVFGHAMRGALALDLTSSSFGSRFCRPTHVHPVGAKPAAHILVEGQVGSAVLSTRWRIDQSRRYWAGEKIVTVLAEKF